MYPERITKEEVNQLDLNKYNGKVVVISDPKKLEEAFKEINTHSVVGFDTETKPTFKKGEINDVALIQIALPEKVFLIRLNYVGLAEEVKTFFENTSIHKIGVALRDDVIALQRMADFNPSGFVELNDITSEMGIVSSGIRNLTAMILGFRISKNAQISNWENDSLTEKQIWYAATDAWVCLEIYQKLLYQGYIV